PRRVKDMLEQLGATFALTTPELAGSLAGICDAVVLKETEGSVPKRDANADSVAYVMFTSGSTGVPNAVPVTLSGFAKYLGWASKTYDLANRDGAFVHTSPAFDLTLTPLFGP